MKRTNLKRTLGLLSAAGLAVVTCFVQSSCSDLWSEQHPGSYYINSGQTVASFLEEGEYKESFTDFVYILKKANIWGELRTYGEHTCFAPDNAAIQEYLEERYAESPDSTKQYFESLESLPVFICDSIAKTHLCNTTFFCTDMNGEGAFPYPNLLDRFLTYNSFADTTWYQNENGVDTFKIALSYKVNQVSRILEADDTVQNGVVHIIDKVLRPSNRFIPGFLNEVNEKVEDKFKATIFYDAIMATGINDELEKFVDASYPGVSYDSTLSRFRTPPYNTAINCATSVEKDWGVFPEKREFKYTLFLVTDSILKEKYDIENLDDLRAKANQWYCLDMGVADDPDETSRLNSLNKFISYHILPCWLSYDQLTTTQKSLVEQHNDVDGDNYADLDMEDFYEAYLPHSIMRISAPIKNKAISDIYINRKGIPQQPATLGAFIPGIRVWRGDEHQGVETGSALNGGFHYLEDVLLYNTFTREEALDTRMRITASTLSPDFINSGARGRLQVNGDRDRYVVGFLKGYCTNFEALNDVTQYWVRYRDAAFGTFNGDEMTVRGIYDVAVKLPPVPFDGTYEVRVWNNCNSIANDRGIVQYYFREGAMNPADKNEGWKPCGLPIDLRLPSNDASIGVKSDDDIKNELSPEDQSDDKAVEAAKRAYDKAIHNRGYMKAMDSYASLRTSTDCYRKIICSEYMKANEDYYIRLRQLLDDGVNPFSFIEIVPKDVYASEIITEDAH